MIVQIFSGDLRENGTMDETSKQKRFTGRFSRVVSHGMRLMVTCEGWIGITHSESQPGETIYTMYGCALPLILQKSPHGYRTIEERHVYPIEQFRNMDQWDQDNWTDIFIE